MITTLISSIPYLYSHTFPRTCSLRGYQTCAELCELDPLQCSTTHAIDLMPAFLKEQNPNPEFYYYIGENTEGLPSFYQVSFHSHEYIHKRWSEYFAVRKIIPKGVGNQDLVLCQRVA